MVPRDRPAWQLISFAIRICQHHSCHTRESSMQTDHSYYAVPTLQHASFHVWEQPYSTGVKRHASSTDSDCIQVVLYCTGNFHITYKREKN
jgi:hypothetical protein